MKDLYKRLDLSPEGSKKQIRARLRKIENKELERAGRKILLRPSRKEVYDRNYRMLRLLGELRGRLELYDAPNWKRVDATDFEKTVSHSSSGLGWFSTDRKGRSRSKNYGEDGQGFLSKSVSSLIAFLKGVGTLLKFVFKRVPVGLQFILLILLAVYLTTDSPSSGPELEEDSKSEPQVESPGTVPEVKSPEKLNVNPEATSGEDKLSKSPKPLPSNGTWWDWTSKRKIAPLRISVAKGQHYYVKLVDVTTKHAVVALFVRSGQTAQTDVPIGRYRLKYAIGNKWYGPEEDFGPEAKFFEAEETFFFERIGQRVRGHKVELIVQSGGNLPTDQIPEAEF